jgi:hypothetical protein
MENKEQIWYTVPDYKGNPTRVRASEVEAFLELQEQLKVNPPDPKKLDKMVEQMLEELWAEDGITPPEENLF